MSNFCAQSCILMPYQDRLNLNKSILFKHLLTDVNRAVVAMNDMLSIETDAVIVLALRYFIL